MSVVSCQLFPKTYLLETVVNLKFHTSTVEPHYNEDLGTMKIALFLSGVSYKELGRANLPYYKKFCYILSDLFIRRFH